MQIEFLGQAGWLVRTHGKTIIVDPYFSDSVKALDEKKYRRVPVREEWLQIQPDVLLFTHDHLDHFDPETALHFLDSDRPVTVLAPRSAYLKARALVPGAPHNFVELNRHSEWTEGPVRFTAVKAAHSDAYAVGFLVEAEGKLLYFTGDTLYNTEIFEDVSGPVDAVFLPVNGQGNNMNVSDAVRFAERIGAKTVFPCHFGMLDDMEITSFPADGAKIASPGDRFEL